jgi:signal transduction histidine kinase
VLLALIVLSIVPLLAVAYQGYHCGRMAVLDLTRLHVISVLEARQAIITSWLDERIRDVSALVRQPVFISQLEVIAERPDPTARVVLEGIIESIQSFEAPFESITVFDSQWHVVVSSAHGSHDDGDIATDSFKQQIREAEGVFFDEAHLHEGHEVGTHIGSAIRNASGTIIGYLVANLNLTRSLTPLLQARSGLWRTGKAYLLDETGRIITEPFDDGRNFAFQKSGSPAQLRGSESGGQDVQIYRDFLSHEVVGATVSLRLHQWRLTVEIDKTEAAAWVHVLLFRVTIMVSIAFLAVLLVSTWMSGQLGRPLARLAAVAHRISEGHTEERVGPMNVAEAEEVRRAVNQMLDELREKEGELIRTATLATVGELTSSVVHEMRNPLSSIKMNLQSLRLVDNSDEQSRELAEIAYEQAWRLEAMLNELLQYGRPVALSLETVDLRKLLDAVIASVEGISREHGVDVTVSNDLEDTQVAVDVELFRRALVNLVQNGIEASPRGGCVSVHAYPSSVYADGVCLAIEDEGPGFRSGQLGKLFKPFFTTKSQGIGLGLANVKKIVDIHGGTVEASNRESGGAIFQIDLPQKVS